MSDIEKHPPTPPSPSSRSIKDHSDKDYNNKDQYHEGIVDVIDPDAEFGGTERRKEIEKKLLWKIDLRMSIMIVIYILNYIDRNNAGAARLRGFEKDLGLHGTEFATLLSILYVGYIIMQVPSNMFLNWIGKPSLYLPACMVVWGVISVLTGITHNFVGALLTRFFLGFIEAAFFPGALFLLSKWYKRDELGLRTAILYCGNIISNAFGALMASGILDTMQGKLGHAAWRWLFFIEGALTIFVAVIAVFILPDFPATTRWISDEERRLAMRRMEEDAGVGDERQSQGQSQSQSQSQGQSQGQGTGHHEGEGSEKQPEGTMHGLYLAVTDPWVWWFALMLTSQTVALSFNAYFPTLSATMGFNRTVTLLLCAPPFIFAAICAFLLNRHSDKTGERYYHAISSLGVGILGFVIAISTMNTAARYISLFLMAQSYAGFVVIITWMSGSFPRPASKRAVALALINAFSQLGNVSGSYVWASTWGPTYRKSYGICIATSGMAIIMGWVFRKHLISLNNKMEKEEKETGGPIRKRYLL